MGKKTGPKEKILDDPIAEAKRQKANESARRYKAKIRAMNKQIDTSFLSKDKTPDKDGIRPIDERRYKKCFTSYYIGFPIDVIYIRRMTGLTLKQIYILQEKNEDKFKPYPRITRKDAFADQERRERLGDIY